MPLPKSLGGPNKKTFFENVSSHVQYISLVVPAELIVKVNTIIDLTMPAPCYAA